MNQNTTNGQPSIGESSGIRRAEEILTKSILRFESAIENLSHRVGTTSQRVHNVLGMAEKHRAELSALKGRATDVIDPLIPLIRQAGGLCVAFSSQVRANPRRYIFSFLGIAGGIIAWSYFDKENSSPKLSS
ncbi:MAG: hypothetical protein H7061_03845 [Bdellovibrionaceae bacterium]|nr:hypothetical protein [Bdellovibrio sp.]